MSPEEKIREILKEGPFNKLKNMFQNKQPQNSAVVELGGGAYSIKGNEAVRIAGPTKDQLMDYDWENGDLSWLADATWKADHIQMSLTSNPQKVISLNGTWYDGNFQGGNFLGNFKKGTFQGQFNGKFNQFEAHPSSFINGTITYHQEGVLGIQKSDETKITTSSSRNFISLLEIQAGHFVNILGEDGETYVFRVTKNIDNISSNIEIEEINGLSPKSFVIRWANLRTGPSRSMFDRLSRIVIGQNLAIPFLFDNDPVGVVQEISITANNIANPISTQPLELDTLELNLLYPLDFTTSTNNNPMTTIQLNNKDEAERFEKLKRSLDNKDFYKYLRSVLDGIELGLIDGYKGYPVLKWLFSDYEGTGTASEAHNQSMAWLQEFMSLVPLKVVVNKALSGNIYKPHDRLRNKILTKIKDEIDRVSPDRTAQPTPQPSAQQQGGNDDEVSGGIFEEVTLKVKHLLKDMK